MIHLRRRMLARRDQLLTSWLTVGEVLTKPKESRNAILEKSYLNFFSSGSIGIVAFEAKAAERHSEIRSRNRSARPTQFNWPAPLRPKPICL